MSSSKETSSVVPDLDGPATKHARCSKGRLSACAAGKGESERGESIPGFDRWQTDERLPCPEERFRRVFIVDNVFGPGV